MTQSDVSAASSEGSSARSAISHAGNSRGQVDLDRSARSFGVGSVQLADLEEVDVRTVFQRDGDGFSGWLAGNLDRLAKELGVTGLREIGRDIAVGSFTVDILAQTDKGRRVAIANQLEASDHMHLGQVITFAAGLEVSAVIWITTRVERRGQAERLAEGRAPAAAGELAVQLAHARVLDRATPAFPGRRTLPWGPASCSGSSRVGPLNLA